MLATEDDESDSVDIGAVPTVTVEEFTASAPEGELASGASTEAPTVAAEAPTVAAEAPTVAAEAPAAPAKTPKASAKTRTSSARTRSTSAKARGAGEASASVTEPADESAGKAEQDQVPSDPVEEA